MLYDLIIIGGGPAGLSAAIYAVRKKLKTLVLAEEIGGQIAEAHSVENYLGISEISGADLIESFRKHAEKFNTEIRKNIVVDKITPRDELFEVAAGQDIFSSRAIIAASGKIYRELNIPGAKEFAGKGISYCATCDAPLFKNKTVIVIGAGDAGQDVAWQLTRYAAKIFLLNKYPEMRGNNIQMREQIKNNDKIEVINNANPTEIKGDKFVKSLSFRYNDREENQEIAVDGIFVEIGSAPRANFLSGIVDLNEKGEIIINHRDNSASLPGIFAAGDVTDTPYKQLIIAAGEGAKATLSAYNYLTEKNK